MKYRYILVAKMGPRLDIVQRTTTEEAIKQARREHVLECDGHVLAIDLQTGETVPVP